MHKHGQTHKPHCVIYGRVSTDERVTEDISTLGRMEACRAYALTKEPDVELVLCSRERELGANRMENPS